ncbi:MAG: hypothetical protein LQ342_007810 [Letrouitia transgressa]|nr:MAG: hypothetical protein LQ342_007810 [Letrouitia transgressa]
MVAAMAPLTESSTSQPSEYPSTSPLSESNNCSTKKVPTPPSVASGQAIVSDILPAHKQTEPQKLTNSYKDQGTQTCNSRNYAKNTHLRKTSSSQQLLDETSLAFNSANTESTTSLGEDTAPCFLDTLDRTALKMKATDVCGVEGTKALGEAQVFNGRTQIVTVRHDEQDCYAILITTEMVKGLDEIIEAAALLRNPEQRLEKLERKVNTARINLEYVEEQTREVESPEEVDKLTEEGKIYKTTLAKYEPRYEELKVQTRTLRRNLEFAEEESQELFRDVLTNAGLVKPTSTDQITNDDNSSDTSELNINQVDSKSQHDDHTPNSTPSRKSSVIEEQSHAEKARFELQLRRRELRAADQKFEKRHEVYDSEKARFDQNKADHEWSDTQTNFDHWHIEFTQGCAKDLDVAEKLYDEALMNDVRLNPDQEFNPDEPFNSPWDEDDEIFFVVHEGYPQISGEEDVVDPESHEAVYHWLYLWVKDIPDMIELGEEEDMEAEAVLEGAEWEVRSAGFSDTWSSYDPICYRKRIDYWNKTTGRER